MQHKITTIEGPGACPVRAAQLTLDARELRLLRAAVNAAPLVLLMARGFTEDEFWALRSALARADVDVGLED